MSDGDEAGSRQPTGSSTGGSAPADPRRGWRPLSGGLLPLSVERNYRLWFMGQTASLVGTWMQSTALGFPRLPIDSISSLFRTGRFCLRRSRLAFHAVRRGYVGPDVAPEHAADHADGHDDACLHPGSADVSRVGAAVADRGAGLCAGGGERVRCAGVQAFVVELVAREDLGNAIALNSTMVNLATAIGPALAGVTYALFGPGWCFTINGISFLAVIIALLMMRLQPQPRRAHKTSTVVDLKEGLRYVVSHPIIRVPIATRSRLHGLWAELCDVIAGMVGDYPGGRFHDERLPPVGAAGGAP